MTPRVTVVLEPETLEATGWLRFALNLENSRYIYPQNIIGCATDHIAGVRVDNGYAYQKDSFIRVL